MPFESPDRDDQPYHASLPREESLTLRDCVRLISRLDAKGRTEMFSQMMVDQRETQLDALLLRQVQSPTDREVSVRDHQGDIRSMLMFGANDYMGFANHPYVRERMIAAVQTYGAGISGPPMLNGYTALARSLEERLAAYEGMEDAMLFSSGYAANVGLMGGLPGRRDLVIHDADCHASFHDGLRMAGNPSRSFTHNDPEALGEVLSEHRGDGKDVFVGVEGVYSMSGALAPLDKIAAQCRRHDALLFLDDAHGTGVAGPLGRGTATRFGVEDSVTAVVGTFSKTFAVTGGFITGSRAVTEYLRYFARPYFFSSSLPPASLAAVHAGLDLIEQEPERHNHLMALCRQTADGLRRLGYPADDRTPIFPIPVPMGMGIRSAAHAFHQEGIFLNHIEFPAVKTADQRFRVSLSASHTADDVDRLLSTVADVMERFRPQGDSVPSGDIDIVESARS